MDIKAKILKLVEDFEDKWEVAMEYDFVWHDVITTDDQAYLKAYGDLRKQIVDELIQYCVKEVGANVNVSSVGSTTLTSDYDVTLSGSKTAEVINLFNKIFEDIFGNDSGEVFDTNLYGTGFYEPITTKSLGANEHFKVLSYVNSQNVTKKVKYIYIDEAQFPEFVQDQHIWALIKLILRMKSSEYTYVDTLSKSEEFGELYEKAMTEALKLPRLNPHDAELRYVEQLKKVQALEDEYDQAPIKHTSEIHNLIRQYQDAISLANYYGVETYFTRGAFFHVVGQQQTHINRLPIMRSEYIDSFIENLAETLKALKDYHEGRFSSHYEVQDRCFQWLLAMAKYYYRAMDALYHVYKDTVGIEPEVLEAVKNIGDELYQLYKAPKLPTKAEMYKIHDIYESFLQSSNFKCTTSSTLDEVRKEMLKILFDVL